MTFKEKVFVKSPWRCFLLAAIVFTLQIKASASMPEVPDTRFRFVADLEVEAFPVGKVLDGVFTGGSLPTTTPTISITTGPYMPSIEQTSSEDWDWDQYQSHRPIFFLWPDGTIFWSEDMVTGDGRYMTGKISPFEIPLFFQRPDVSSIVRGEPYPYVHAYLKASRTTLTIVEHPQKVAFMWSTEDIMKHWIAYRVSHRTDGDQLMMEEGYPPSNKEIFGPDPADGELLKAAALDLIPLATDLKEVPRDEVRFGRVFGAFEKEN